jgi:hypothetical protein
MQNSNEENFKKKYFKYKAKYLELKDVLEGGTLEEDTKKKCEILKDKNSCSKIFGCTANKIFPGCNFNKEKYKAEFDADISARVMEEHRRKMRIENSGIKY